MEERIKKKEDEIKTWKAHKFNRDKMDYEHGRIYTYARKYDILGMKEKMNNGGDNTHHRIDAVALLHWAFYAVCRECDLEAAELGLPPGSPDREEKRQGRIQVPETRRVRGPGLGRTRDTMRKQRWAEVKRVSTSE
ncbi:hypothetical protein NDU88_000984 [Pleurodeles waltl]|uniref:Uncharacterized protein n=1 Tax=Pleurodeles waltl TaxID=8319 RepID=A0AAV7L890_PLEWA|nr:hypothetical protein NDU88_000984 [Pleurodeles waltl]